jgi:hypothetical protein
MEQSGTVADAEAQSLDFLVWASPDESNRDAASRRRCGRVVHLPDPRCHGWDKPMDQRTAYLRSDAKPPKGTGDTTLYAINGAPSWDGTKSTVPITPNLATNARKVGGDVIRMEGYGIKSYLEHNEPW